MLVLIPCYSFAEYDTFYIQSGYSTLKALSLPERNVVHYTKGISLDVGTALHHFSDTTWMSAGLGYSNHFDSLYAGNKSQSSSSLSGFVESNFAIFIGRLGYSSSRFENPDLPKRHFFLFGIGFLLHPSYLYILGGGPFVTPSEEIVKKHSYNIVLNIDWLRNGDTLAKKVLLGLRINI